MTNTVDDVAPVAGGFVHRALVYRGLEAYLAGTVPFVLDGLDAGGAVAVAVPGPNLELLADALGERSESVQLLDMTLAGRNPGRILPGVLRKFADAHRDRTVRIIGEPVWQGRTSTEYPACVQHEALINMAFSSRDVAILCPYDAERLEASVLTDATATHPCIEDGGRVFDSPDFAPDRVITAYNLPLADPGPAAQVLPFDEQNLPQPRWAAARWAVASGVEPARIADLELVVAELATNSVVHGGGSGIFRVWTEEGHLVCEVRDHGHLTDPLVGRRPADHVTPGGRGMLLVNLLSDLVRVHTTTAGTAVRVYFAHV